MSGIRDLSLIATPPVDRLAVRTNVGPFDPVVARETLLREHYRGGQSFYVAPRIKDLTGIAEFLRDELPELKFKIAHGQMGAGELEDIMTAFYEGKFDVLVSTTIIESGLDIPTANTMLIHHADMFGLAQLYQLRGRVWALETARIRLPDNKPTQKIDRRRGTSSQGHAIARYAWRGLYPCKSRSGHSRRRQSVRRGTVRQCQRSRR